MHIKVKGVDLQSRAYKLNDSSADRRGPAETASTMRSSALTRTICPVE